MKRKTSARGSAITEAPGDPEHDLTCGQSGDAAYANQFGGTSGAAPKVAGVVALMLSVNPDLTHADVREILAGTGSPLTEDPGKPIGVFLNAEAAVAEALRRRAETAPDGNPNPELTVAKPLHGLRRRSSQLLLPDDLGNPISWETAPENGPAATRPPPVRGEQPPANDKTLESFRRSVEGTLTQQDRILIVAQAIQMLDNFYVHRPLKEAIHAVRPIQRLRVLLRRLQQTANIPEDEKDELTFHNTLTEIFNSLRDLHTNYQLPRPYRNFIAYLPFEVAHFYEDNTRRYLVTRVAPDYQFANEQFKPGAEIVLWNGMAIERAVRRNADQTAGSNEAARHARGVSALTIRPMNTALPPDSDFVEIEFVPEGASPNDATQLQKMRQYWFVRYSPIKSSAPEETATTSAGARADSRTGPAPTDPAPPAMVSPSATASHSSLDLGRESQVRSSAIIFEGHPPAPSPSAPDHRFAAAEPQQTPMRNLALAAVLGLDTAADAVREARQLIFDPSSVRTAEHANIGEEVSGIRGSASPGTVAEVDATEIKVKVPWNSAFRARSIDIAGISYGHIHIRTFNFEDADGFVEEFVRLVGQVKENGLILDVRGNSGGNILAAERLLQILSPVEIAPERMQFVVTPGTLDLCRNNPASSQIPLHLWRPSLEEAVETAAVYSHAFALTTEDTCNVIGQRYYGPVVLLVDGNSYSATDMFAAGFQDHRIGEVIGVNNNTGAGGANVWEHWLLTKALPIGWGLKPLPNQAGMRVAIRQCLRVGPKAGALLEDFGVVPDKPYKLRRVDLMEGDKGLLKYAADLLAGKKPRGIVVEKTPSADPTKVQITIRTRGLNRLDFIIDDRPRASIDLPTNAAGEAVVKPLVDRGAKLKLVGYQTDVTDWPAKDQAAALRPAALYRGGV
jgi:C-terminal processing protease CtpA/Prc